MDILGGVANNPRAVTDDASWQPPPTARPARPGRAYWSLLAATGVSNLSDGIRLAAFPLLAVQLTDAPFLVAAATAVVTLPWLVLALPAGVMADRLDRRRVMLAAHLSSAVALTVLAVAATVGVVSLPLLYGVGVVVGAGEVMFSSAAHSVLPATVPDRNLERANGRYVVAEITGDQFAGPPLGSALFAVAVAVPFGVQVGLVAAGAAFTLAMGGRYRPRRDDAPSGLVREAGTGIRWLLGHRALRIVTLVAGVMSMVDAAGLAVLVLLWTDVLALGSGSYGVALTAGGVGGIAGSLTAARIRDRVGTRASLLCGVVCLAAGHLGLAMVSGAVSTIALVGLSGIAYGLWGVTSVSLRQRLTPDGLLGRVGSAHRLVALGAAPIGALLGGAVANLVSVRATFLTGGLLLLLGLAVVARLLTTERLTPSVVG